MNSEIWKRFGSIRCIHIPERRDRRVLMDSLQEKLDLPLEYYFTSKHPEGGMKGCFLSHQQVMQETLQKMHETCLIVEDDICLSKHFSWSYVLEVLHFLKSCKNWDIVYLGCFPDILRDQINVGGHMFKVKATQTHAYVCHRNFMKKFVAMKYEGTAIDEIFYRKAKCYALLPSLFYQASTPSDVEKSVVPISEFPLKQFFVSAVENYTLWFGHSLLEVLRLCVAALVFILILKSNIIKNYGHASYSF